MLTRTQKCIADESVCGWGAMLTHCSDVVLPGPVQRHSAAPKQVSACILMLHKVLLLTASQPGCGCRSHIWRHAWPFSAVTSPCWGFVLRAGGVGRLSMLFLCARATACCAGAGGHCLPAGPHRRGPPGAGRRRVRRAAAHARSRRRAGRQAGSGRCSHASPRPGGLRAASGKRLRRGARQQPGLKRGEC